MNSICESGALARRTGSRVLVVEASDIGEGVAHFLKCVGFEVSRCASAAEARAVLRAGMSLRLGLIEFCLPDGSGLEILEELRNRHPESVAAIVAHEVDSRLSVECWRRGVPVFVRPVDVGAVEVLANEGARLSWLDGVRGFANAFKLSGQEERAVRLAVAGTEVLDAAEALGCTTSTADTYWRRIFRKTGLRSKLAVVAAVARRAY